MTHKKKKFGVRQRANWPRQDELMQRRLAIAGALDEPHDDGTSRALIRWTVGVFVIAIGWAAVTPISETVVAEGLILPLDGARPAQHLEGGVVDQVLVREGDTVAAGDVLVRINVEEARAAIAALQARRNALAAKAERQYALLSGGVLEETLGGPWADQAQVLNLQETVAAAEARTLASLVELAKVQLEAAQGALAALKHEIELLRSSLDRKVQLAARGNVSKVALEDAERRLAITEREEAIGRGEAAAAALRLDQARFAQVQRAAERQALAAENFANINADLAELDKEIAHLGLRVKRETVVAPVAGRVQNLAVADPGQVVAAGAVIATVVPVTGEMFAELEVSADRIGEIKVGLKAVVKILTYDFARFGGVPAEVMHVSPTSEVDDNGEARYRVRLRLETASVSGNDALSLRPGMSVTADLQTGKKTVLEYFFKPLRVLRDRALTES